MNSANRLTVVADTHTLNDVEPVPLLRSVRLIQTVICFFTSFQITAPRVGMSVAIVSMVNHTAVRQLHEDSTGMFKTAFDYANTSSTLSSLNSSFASSSQCLSQGRPYNKIPVCKIIHSELSIK
jgi:hypothetical protein